MNVVAAPAQLAARFTKITDDYRNHIITRDNHTGLYWAAWDIGKYQNDVYNSEAEKACRELRLGGRDDWRLPTADELLTLADRSHHHQAIDINAFPNLCPFSSYEFWSSTPVSKYWEYYAWVVSFNTGSCRGIARGCYLNVRPVRDPNAAAAKAGA